MAADETVQGLAQDVANVLAAVLADDELAKVFEALDALWSTPPHGTLRSDAPYGAGTFMFALSDVLPFGAHTGKAAG